jgi:hypothetical protein
LFCFKEDFVEIFFQASPVKDQTCCEMYSICVVEKKFKNSFKKHFFKQMFCCQIFPSFLSLGKDYSCVVKWTKCLCSKKGFSKQHFILENFQASFVRRRPNL